MDLSKIKMVVTDMDGTLLNSNHEVSNRFFELFAILKQKNIHFVAASGRQYHSIVDKLSVIKDDITFISENGAFIKKQDREISVIPINQSLTGELLDVLDSVPDSHTMLCGKYKSYFNGKSLPYLEQLKEYYSTYEIVDDYKNVTDEIVKIAVYHDTSAETYIYPKVAHYKDQVKVKISGQHWVDINHTDAHKGNALQRVMEIHQITTNEVLVFGDYNNDLEMLALSEYSFAMANAHPNVKKVAKYNTLSNDNNGVEFILEKLISLK